MSFSGDYSYTEPDPDVSATQSYGDIVDESHTFTYPDADDSQVAEERLEKDPTTGIENLNTIPPILRYLNFVAFLFQCAQAGILGWLASEANTEWPIYVNFPSQSDGDQAFGTPQPKQVAAFSITWYSCAFIGLSALDHLIVCSPGLASKYNYYIERHQNPFRWTEYAFSAGLMRVMISQLSGVTDIHILFGVFMLTAITMILGSIHESVNAVARADGYRQNWYPFLAAWLPHIASWSIIFCYFFVAVVRSSPPAFVWIIVFVLFVLDGTFALLFYLQWAKIGMFRDYVKGEMGFVALSFTSKACLAWITYAGGSR